MTCRFDKVETGMDTRIEHAGSTRLLFLTHVFFMLLVDKVNDGCPTISVVDKVAKAWRVNDG